MLQPKLRAERERQLGASERIGGGGAADVLTAGGDQGVPVVDFGHDSRFRGRRPLGS